jgi:hypothetical protein
VGAAAGGPGGAAGAAGAPQAGDVAPGVTAGEAGWPHPPAVAGRAGVPAPQPGEGGVTTVGAMVAGRAGAGGAHVAATPAVWFTGAGGRTGGADFLLRRRRRVLR